MTEQEMKAKEELESNLDMPFGSDVSQKSSKCLLAALEELEKYRTIGTIDEFREAKEKQIPKKLKYYGDSEDGAILCPNCESALWDLKECGFDNCPYCGQAIDWGNDHV